MGPGDIGRKLVCDLDGDGSNEIVTSGSRGKVSILESMGDNAWALRWRYETGLQGAYGVAGGLDGDGNGRPEVLVTGSVFAGWRTVVIEATCNNYYAERTRLEAAVGGSGLATVIADIDGRPPYEFLAFSLGGIAVWRPRTNGQWDMIGTIPDPNFDHAEHISVADMNKNGRDEIFWGGLVTTVYEAAGPTSTGPPEQRTVSVTRLRITPNPCRGECTLSFLGAAPPCDTRLEIYDVAGRVVSSLQGPFPSAATVRWTPHLASGRYFLQARTSQGRTVAPHVALAIAK